MWISAFRLGLKKVVALILIPLFVGVGSHCDRREQLSNSDRFSLPERHGPADFDNATLDMFRQRAAAGEEGFLFSIRGLPEMCGTIKQRSFWLLPDSSFKGEMLIGNYTADSVVLKVICMVDYVQTKFKFVDRIAKSHRFALAAKQEKKYLLEIPSLRRGFHDLLLIVFKNPEIHITDTQFRHVSQFMHLDYRANLYIGVTRPQTVKYVQLGESPAPQNLTGMVLNRLGAKNPWFLWYTDSFPKGEVVGYYINISNATDEDRHIVLLSFLDFEQIPLNFNNSNNIVLFAELRPHQQTTIEASFKTPGSQEAQELVVLWVENPYIELEPEPGIITHVPTIVRSSMRTLVSVED